MCWVKNSLWIRTGVFTTRESDLVCEMVPSLAYHCFKTLGVWFLKKGLYQFGQFCYNSHSCKSKKVHGNLGKLWRSRYMKRRMGDIPYLVWNFLGHIELKDRAGPAKNINLITVICNKYESTVHNHPLFSLQATLAIYRCVEMSSSTYSLTLGISKCRPCVNIDGVY